MKKLGVFIAFLIAGCSTTSGLEPSVSHSGFDNATIISIEPHGNACDSMVCTGIGAQWSSSKPEQVILIMSIFNEYSGITDVQLNIDGKKIQLQPTRTITDLNNNSAIKTSTKAFVADLQLIDSILSSQRTWVRVHTPTGYLEDAVIDNGKDSKSYHALSRFMRDVRSN
ncbi:hypothetical protein [Vibrio atlanticus]|uniref:Lipoprotein n=1 Tax=Vibrio atlanticus TaxID=693153 RepID=A0A1C3IMS5_9VIBR|nr:hypothetical protein [Vibrio atlanticus]SBS62722.1 hypothetical protein VAT7223_01316 [Vibrio atlanticus]